MNRYVDVMSNIEDITYRHQLWEDSIREIQEKDYPFLICNSQGEVPKYTKDTLYAIEPIATFPYNYNINTIKQFKYYITSSGKFYSKMKQESINAFFVSGCPRWYEFKSPNGNDHSRHFKSFEQKINGVCMLSRSRTHGPNWPTEEREYDIERGNIIAMREYLLERISISTNSDLIFHLYGANAYGGNVTNQGFVENKFEIISKYKFHLCFDSVYHPIFSYDRISEKLIDCMLCKTIPIYLGCWNIEEYIPIECIIDFRKYISNLQQMVDDMSKISMSQYEDIVETGYQVALDLTSNYGTPEQVCSVLNRVRSFHG